MKSVTLQVDDEIAALGDAVIQEVADIKAAKGVAVYAADLIPLAVSLSANYSKLGADVKNPDDLAYLVKCIATAFIPQPAPAA